MAEAKSRPPAENGAASLDAVLTDFLARLTPADARLCVALSGGRDSVVLLHALARLLRAGNGRVSRVSLSALHVNHGISANADAWATFCADFCQRCAVPLSVVGVAVPRDSGEGLEAAARRLRHGAFARCAADYLALAHHRDDQAETVLLNLLRGAGVAGAAGMSARRRQAAGPPLLRPLLETPRALLEDYASAHALAWIDDESNDDTHFRRNFLRCEVMPRLAAKFPGAQKSLARAAAHFAEGAQLLDELAAIDRAAAAAPSGRIALGAFNALSGARARNLLRFVWLGAGFRAPDSRWIAEAMRQLASADSLSETCVATVDGELHVYRGEIHVVAPPPALPPPRPCPADLSALTPCELPWAGGTLRFVAARGAGIGRHYFGEGSSWIRLRQGGERLRLAPGRPRRALRKLLQEAAIPPWERERLPLLWIGDALAWVGGLGVDAAFACAPGEAGLLPVWEPVCESTGRSVPAA